MKFIICGCGRVGSIVAQKLSSQNHTVTIIDKDKKSFNRLSDDFKGEKVVGDAINNKVLLSCGIKKAFGFIALTNGDNTNIILSRIAKNIYDVKNVVTRIYDPNRASIYEKLGFPVVSTSTFAASEVLRNVLTTSSEYKYVESSGNIALANFKYSDDWIGEKIFKINEIIEHGNVAYVKRNGSTFIPNKKSVLQEADEINIVFQKNDKYKIGKILKSKEINE